MAIDIDTARKVAKLARIRVEEADLPKLAGQLSGILGFMEELNEVDVEGVEPMTSPVESVNRLAEDVPSPTLSNAQFMAIAANWSDGSENRTAAEPPFIAVPKVLGGGGEGA